MALAAHAAPWAGRQAVRGGVAAPWACAAVAVLACSVAAFEGPQDRGALVRLDMGAAAPQGPSCRAQAWAAEACQAGGVAAVP